MSSIALKLPKNYVEIERNEMEYVDGGYYINNTNLKALLSSAVGSGLVGTAAIEAGIYGIAAGLATVPGLGWVTGGLLAVNAGGFAIAAGNALLQNKGVDINPGFPAGLSFSVR